MLNDVEYRVLKALEDGLPLVPDPFGALARQNGISREIFCATLQSLKDRGIIRRVGVVLWHNKAGIKGNIMAAFKVPQTKLAYIGHKLAQYPQISHCYSRTSDADWPYNLYAMIHALTPKAAEELAETICREFNITDYELLPTISELKKSSFELPAQGSYPVADKDGV